MLQPEWSEVHLSTESSHYVRLSDVRNCVDTEGVIMASIHMRVEVIVHTSVPGIV